MREKNFGVSKNMRCFCHNGNSDKYIFKKATVISSLFKIRNLQQKCSSVDPIHPLLLLTPRAVIPQRDVNNGRDEARHTWTRSLGWTERWECSLTCSVSSHRHRGGQKRSDLLRGWNSDSQSGSKRHHYNCPGVKRPDVGSASGLWLCYGRSAGRNRTGDEILSQ